MPSILYNEWRTKNSQRRYPFADDCSLMSRQNIALSDDLFIDAMFYPIGLSGILYLSAVDTLNNKLEVSDNSGILATAALDDTSGCFDFYDQYGRCIGLIVAGEGLSTFVGSMTFEPGATPLSADAVVPQTYGCLNGILLEDGTLVTGDVLWEGENGMTVSTEYLDGVPVIRFDAVGVPEDPCGMGTPIRCLKVAQIGTGRALIIGQTGNIITLTTPYVMAELCATKSLLPDEDGNLPDDGDACNPPTPVPCIPPVPHSGTCPATHYTSYYIWPAGDTIGTSIIEWLSGQSQSDPLTMAQGGAQLPARTNYAIEIFMKGA